MKPNAALILEDGSVFPGVSFGRAPAGTDEISPGGDITGMGEVVFNTGMTGYYEILTDPSYTGQLVCMTYPHIGNYGVDDVWNETAREEGVQRPFLKPSAFIVRKLYRGEVPRGRQTLDDALAEHGVPGIEGVDTRRLTLKIRETGSPRGVIAELPADIDRTVAALKSYPSMEGRNLLPHVGTADSYTVGTKKSIRIALMDYGCKANITRELTSRGAEVTVFPSSLSDPAVIFEEGYGGVMLSNGPGDPGVLKQQIDFIKNILGKLPVFGICLGHQLLSLALGAKTYKMKFGHHGCNHPVRDENSGRVFVTSQNHGFAVVPDSIPRGAAVRFMNANDKTIEGLQVPEQSILTAQFHPEAAPGPPDSRFLFDEFIELASVKS